MKKYLLTYIFISIFFLQNIYAQFYWTQKADFPGEARSACIGFSALNYGYIGLGYDGLNFRRSFYTYDPLVNSWLQITSLGGETGSGLERDVAAGFTLGTKEYLGTGQGGAAYLNDFWMYDATTDVWTQKANFAGSMRRSAVGFSAGGYGFIGLGQDASGFLKDLWKYDTLANTWTAKSNFPGTARRLAVAFSIESKAYIGTGDDGTFTKDFYTYNAFLDSWSPIAEFPASPRYGATAFSMAGKGYVLTGYDTTLQNTNDFWQYDPVLNNWTQLEDFPGSKRSNAVSFSINDSSAYIGMGYDTTFRSDFWKYGDTNTIIIDTTDTTINSIQINPIFSASVFPNPFSDMATIQINSELMSDGFEMHIYNAAGREVTNNIIWVSAGIHNNKYSLTFQKGSLTAGMYAFIISGKKNSASGKFIIIER